MQPITVVEHNAFPILIRLNWLPEFSAILLDSYDLFNKNEPNGFCLVSSCQRIRSRCCDEYIKTKGQSLIESAHGYVRVLVVGDDGQV